MKFTVIFEKEEEGYSVSVPSLPGCFTQGDTLDEATRMAKDAIQGHIESLLQLGRTIPTDQPAVLVNATDADEILIRRLEVDFHASFTANHG
ncbi:type II toxin-antitoxin system HicB family antitoxin [Sulfoacidibacillus ferrooxidans]|nr:type II toxin-antitoxin system HicB family antitoxin [Sulfoacidibacillus ferrooxidans]